LSQFFLESLRHSTIRSRLDVQEGIPEVPLKPEIRHHLFLVTKEAINNIIKHSHATEASLVLAMENGEFEVRIQDNGRGLDKEMELKQELPAQSGRTVARSARNGLRNMRARAEEMGCVFDLVSQPGGGTLIRIRISVPRLAGEEG
jgi:signal transduction histidine kinase